MASFVYCFVFVEASAGGVFLEAWSGIAAVGGLGQAASHCGVDRLWACERVTTVFCCFLLYWLLRFREELGELVCTSG